MIAVLNLKINELKFKKENHEESKSCGQTQTQFYNNANNFNNSKQEYEIMHTDRTKPTKPKSKNDFEPVEVDKNPTKIISKSSSKFQSQSQKQNLNTILKLNNQINDEMRLMVKNIKLENEIIEDIKKISPKSKKSNEFVDIENTISSSRKIDRKVSSYSFKEQISPGNKEQRNEIKVSLSFSKNLDSK